ncbi:hypothetical protein ACET3Z_000405 [Daucus carota]
MVGLADIPCVGKLVDILSEVAVKATFRGFRYMFCYKDLVKTLESQVKEANTEEERVSREVAAERANGKIIEKTVLDWQKQAEEIKESAKQFAEKSRKVDSWRCIQCLPIPNPVSRLQLGREAVKKTDSLTQLIKSGEKLRAHGIANPALVKNLPKSTTEFQDFQSRKDAYAELWQALVTDSSPILGIYGMPGVGKTRMMEQLWTEAKEKNIFNKVTRVNVGNEKLNVIKLQKEIAGHLGCKLDSEDNAESRASQLEQSLLNAGKTLVVLDDVWREIPLDVIGIPCGDENTSMGSKILFTSREEDVCLHNNCKTLVKITPLRNDEAWDQFKNIVGSARIDSLKDESLAKKVCDKCGGLPLLIHAVGKAVKFKPQSSWVDALQQLEKGNFENISGIDPQVYACVEFSINQLPDDAKSCLFLCCLFGEDEDIPIWKLIQLATGSQLVSGESRVLSMVDTLGSSSLLLDCDKDDSIKLHDVIRNVGRSIAFRDPKFAFSQVTCDVRLFDVSDFVTTKFLRLDLDGDNYHIPDDLVCPDLHSLWIQCRNDIQQFSGGFLSMSANLRYLYVVDWTYPSSKLQFSLQPLGKLRTLIFDNCDLTHINNTNGGFFPENLETLCISYGDFPEPLDLSNLKYLRKLEIEGWKVEIIPNTISSLSRLEQLHIPGGFEIWRDDSSVVAKPNLIEINKLTHLKSLQITFKISEPFQNTNIFDNLKLFNICVGGGRSYLEEADPSYKTLIRLQGYHEESLNSLVGRAEYVKLKDADINVSGIFDSNPEAFTELRELHIEKCHNMEHLARMSQGEIKHSQQTSFSKLTCLVITECSSLRYLFCNSVAKCLTQLQKLMIQECPVMEAIVMNEGSSNKDIISFSHLKELKLRKVPRLKSFCREFKDTMTQPSAQLQPLFHRMGFNNDNCGSSFCKLTSIYVQECNRLETVIPVVMLQKLQNLQYLEIYNCHSLTNVFPCSSVPRGVMHLEEITVARCWKMKGILGGVEQGEIIDVLEFPELRWLDLNLLPDFTSFCGEEKNASTKVEFPNLIILMIKDCYEINLESIEFTGQPKSLHISCYNETQLPSTWQPRLHNVETLILSGCWWHEIKSLQFQRLKRLDVVKYSGCSALFTFSGLGSLQHLQELEISDCAFLEEIAEDDKMSSMNKKTITLPHLKIVVLKNLPKLKSIFHGANYGSRVPSLIEVKIENCGLSSLFSFSEFTRLKTLEISRCDHLEEIVEDTRTDEISGMNKKTITLSQLERVVLEDLPKLKSFIYSANQECLLLPKLSYVSVINCGLSSLFTCSAAFESLQRLEYLKVWRCRMLEGIFEYARGDETYGTSDQTIISLSKLGSLELRNLPGLKSFIHGGNYDCSMPALCNMEVDNCGFSTLFTCSVFRNLQRLVYLEVSNCRLLEVIVEDARGEDTNGKTITLPLLRCIELEDLPNLNSFGRDESYAFNMPELNRFGLVGCPRAENFTSFNTNTGNGYASTDDDDDDK